MSHERLADQLLGQACHSRLVLRDLDATRLAAPACMDLRLHDEHRGIELIGPGRRRFRRRHFFSTRDRHPELREQLLRLKLMNVHAVPLLALFSGVGRQDHGRDDIAQVAVLFRIGPEPLQMLHRQLALLHGTGTSGGRQS